ncbi:MAG: hypothetical protein ACLQGP_13655 [Isosphaeraceae bacterium]
MAMRMRLRQLVAVLALIAPGCAADQMRFTALRVAARVPDVYQAQIMENLARTAANPGSMPYLSRLFNGTASTTDTATLIASLTGQAHAFTSVNYGLSSVARGVQANIGIDPIDNPDKLAAMQIAYRKVVAPQTVTPETYENCLGYLLTDMNPCVGTLPPPGWLLIGRKHDVPRDAAAVAHCGATYVWVMPQDLDSLTRFTYFILNIATVSSQRPLATVNSPRALGAPLLTPRDPTPGVNFNLMLTPRP